MQSLRNASLLARLVLAWFVLAVGVAVASPVVKPGDMQLVCSAGGAVKLLKTGEDGGSSAGTPTLDCPLCASIAAPPPLPRADAVFVALPGHSVQTMRRARVAARAAAPLPARGPPASVHA